MIEKGTAAIVGVAMVTLFSTLRMSFLVTTLLFPPPHCDALLSERRFFTPYFFCLFFLRLFSDVFPSPEKEKDGRKNSSARVRVKRGTRVRQGIGRTGYGRVQQGIWQAASWDGGKSGAT